MVEMFHICAVQSSGHEPHVANENLKCGKCKVGTKIDVTFNINSFKFR